MHEPLDAWDRWAWRVCGAQWDQAEEADLLRRAALLRQWRRKDTDHVEH